MSDGPIHTHEGRDPRILMHPGTCPRCDEDRSKLLALGPTPYAELNLMVLLETFQKELSKVRGRLKQSADELQELADWCDAQSVSPTSADLRALARLTYYVEKDQAEFRLLMERMAPWRRP